MFDFARHRQALINWHREHPADADRACGECGASATVLFTTEIGTAFCWPCEKERTAKWDRPAAKPVQLGFKKRSGK